MNIVSIILCGLALLTAIVNTALFFREKKRTNTRLSALNNLLESVEHETNGYILECIGELDKIQGRVGNIEVWKSCTDETMSGHGRSLHEALRKIANLRDEVDELRRAISGLELDYKEAQEAANSVNDYASSLMNIFNYEPMEAAKKARNGGKAE